MIQLVVLATLLIIGLLLMLVLLSRNMAPSKKKLNMEIKRMREDMDTWAGELVPINKEELELFSLGQDKQVLRKGVTTTAKGIYTTIYHEPVLAYSYREYLGNKDKPNALLYVRTAEHDYVYWINKGEVSLFIDGQEVGKITRDGQLLGKRTGKQIASLRRDNPEYLPIVVGQREVGSLTRKQTTSEKGLHQRAFEYLQPELSDKEEQLFLALSALELVERSVKS
ncbi:MAG: hypothetical protein D6772_17560 [Bacteroidetes bacterium]|nr:MAG: hypothetical protein D6772_17560 [Bacteroidota bacterium]